MYACSPFPGGLFPPQMTPVCPRLGRVEVDLSPLHEPFKTIELYRILDFSHV